MAIAKANVNVYLYIVKKHNHIGKKLHMSVLYGTQILNFNPVIFRFEHLLLVENTFIHFQDHRQEINALLAIIYNLLAFLLSCRFE